MKRKKILNLFAGLGGNRTLWGEQHEITAVEYNPEISAIYQKRFPNDIVITGDAYDYFINNFEKYDVIWMSPPCQSHSKFTNFRVGYAYKGKRRKMELPDLRLYSLILFCKHQFRGKWLIENVKGYYKPLITPTTIRGRHYYWSNVSFPSTKKYNGSFGKMGTYASQEMVEKVAKDRYIDLKLLNGLSEYTRNQMLRNMIMPEEGKLIFDYLIKEKKEDLMGFMK